MKIKPKDLDLQSELVSHQPKRAATEKAAIFNPDHKRADDVKVSSLAALLNGQLSPAQFAEERRAKIEDIKARVNAGTYNPASEDVARSLANELTLEILTKGGLVDGGSDNSDSDDDNEENDELTILNSIK